MLPGVRVLAADDDPQLLEAIVASLERLDADVVRARNGAEVIDRLADSGPFDLVVTDIAMPWMTGLSSVRAARTAGLEMPVIVITALPDDTIPAEVDALGANVTLLRKPFDVSDLTSIAERLTRRRPTRSS